MNPLIPGIFAALLYLLGSHLQYRDFRNRRATQRGRLLLFGIPAVLLHGATAYLLAFSTDGLNVGLTSSVAAISFVLSALVLTASFNQPLNNLFILVFPMGAIGVMLGTLLPPTEPIGAEPEGPLLWHILLSVAAYAVLLLAACQSLVLLLQERTLRARRNIALLALLPPLQTGEKLLFRWILWGVLLLTAAIVSGFVFLDDLFAQRIVHHTVLALASWVAFAVLLVGRYRFGWRGTTATHWTLVGFSLLLLGYYGSKFVLEVLLA
ncbi:MAG: cytochrome c biogenesis protein CcsA [Pseudomonadota bacterium]